MCPAFLKYALSYFSEARLNKERTFKELYGILYIKCFSESTLPPFWGVNFSRNISMPLARVE